MLRLDTALKDAKNLPCIEYSVGILKIDSGQEQSLERHLPNVDARMYHHKRSKS
ncbi:hypothetical protein [Shewanella khirikhana]|uniref:GGDEF domain-containing protein n=1 Tax=Shewanella khirikhana TaxID=1965282 RepID=A0ABM7D0P5_9GAMM|nr:hypothetical protein [Shewanella khirikhana]AZQ09903.1 hypothetical protein STH12_00764 [Shewanella khirikhana]